MEMNLMQPTPSAPQAPVSATPGYQVQSTPVVPIPAPAQYSQPYPVQGTAAMAPQAQAMGQVVPFPAQPQYQPAQAMPQGYGQATQAESPLALAREAMYLLANGRSQSPSQVAPSYPTAMPQAQPPMLAPMGTPYQAFPTTSPQAPYSTSTTQASQFDRQAQAADLATSHELANYYGSVENAAVLSNALACKYEDQIVQLQGLIDQVETQIMPRYRAMETLLSDPSAENLNLLSNLYLNLEAINGELLQPQQPAPEQMPQAPQGMAMGQGAMPNVYAASVASQAAQDIHTGQAALRPAFPSIPTNGMSPQVQSIASVPNHMRWQVLDQMQASGALRGLRLF